MFDRILKVKDYDQPQTCECGAIARKRISRPMVFIAPDICYDSPIDGRPITTKQAQDEDLARSNCVPYDPGIRQDYERRIRDNEKRLHDIDWQALQRNVDAVSALFKIWSNELAQRAIDDDDDEFMVMHADL